MEVGKQLATFIAIIKAFQRKNQQHRMLLSGQVGIISNEKQECMVVGVVTFWIDGAAARPSSLRRRRGCGLWGWNFFLSNVGRGKGGGWVVITW